MHNVVINITVSVLLVLAVVFATFSLLARRPLAVALRVGGLLTALTALTIGVHSHGWVTSLDAPTAKWVVAHRSPGLTAVAWVITELGSPAGTAAAALFCAALLSRRARSMLPGAVMIGTVAAAVMAKTVLKMVVVRPRTSPEMHLAIHHFAPAGLNPFPSGHVTGTGALLGMIAVCVGLGRSSVARILLAGLAGAGVLVVAVTRLYIGAHWFTDVIGGVLLAALFVTWGAEVIRYFHARSGQELQRYPDSRSPINAGVLSPGR